MTKGEIENLIMLYFKRIGVQNSKGLKIGKNNGINAWAINNRKIELSSKLVEICINNEKNCSLLLRKVIGHELIHIQFGDNKGGLKWFFYSWIMESSSGIYIKNQTKCNTARMIRLLKEIRADINGRYLAELTPAEYKEAWELECSKGLMWTEQEELFVKGYPTYDIRKKMYKYDHFNKEVIDEIISVYTKFFCMDEKKVYKFFGYLLV